MLDTIPNKSDIYTCKEEGTGSLPKEKKMTVEQKIKEFEKKGYKVIARDSYVVKMIKPRERGIGWDKGVRIRIAEKDYTEGTWNKGYSTHFTKF